ncbi:MAG TPA: DUF1553 domain-containing protein [Pirellulales bacterium]|nr:DUF1553 domain-containing protein [Pirellulales bacterium]
MNSLWQTGLFTALTALLAMTRLAAAEPSARQIEFFETRIRPVLVEHCFECHGGGEKRTQGGLRLDSREGWATGGDSGPAMAPGQPDESLLLTALDYRDSSLQMPPRGRLPQNIIDDFRRWIEQGAADPRRGGPADRQPAEAKPPSQAAAHQHWAYQPVAESPPPEVSDRAWPAGEIDRFILARLEAAGLKPAVDAAPAALVRRLYFDLIGLPPTPEAIDRFVADPSDEAYLRLVERLLASPRFGERWARHWLDVARFGESLTLRGMVFQQAWRYRDYAIDAFNRDLPYNEFVRAQIAGDLLPADSLDERRDRLAATTFLVLGNVNLEEQDKAQLRMDVVDEQLDTIGKVFLAQTLGCARCHDHKFDPIPTRDYYALAGILRNTKTLEHANVSNWLELPLPLDPAEEQRMARHEAQLAALTDRIKTARGSRPAVVAAANLPGVVVDDRDAKQVGAWQRSQYNQAYIGDGYLHDMNAEKGAKTLTFLPQLPRPGRYEVRLAYTAGGNRATNVPVTVFSADGEKALSINERREPPLEGRFISLGQFQFELNGQGFVIVANHGTDGHVIADAVQFLSVDGDAAADATQNETAAASLAAGPLPQDDIRQLEQELKRLKATGPVRPKVMSVVEEREIGDACVHIRGNVHNLGTSVPRGFLQAVGPQLMTPLGKTQSGRRELADWLAADDNPLTARLIANRVWHWLLGAGLVRTTDNFGTAGEAPSHPELLDYLAAQLVDGGWSIKRLVRRIVLSRAYRLSAETDERTRAADPENRLFARAARRRLDAECLRDAMLAVSGQLEPRPGGRTLKPGVSADYGYVHDERYRSIYVPVLRNALPEVFKVFDFADPSLVVGQRSQSTTPQQALFLMNDPFVLDCARQAARRLLSIEGLDDLGRVERSCRLAWGRPASPGEQQHALQFMRATREQGTNEADAWAMYWQTLLASLDFRYLD